MENKGLRHDDELADEFWCGTNQLWLRLASEAGIAIEGFEPIDVEVGGALGSTSSPPCSVRSAGKSSRRALSPEPCEAATFAIDPEQIGDSMPLGSSAAADGSIRSSRRNHEEEQSSVKTLFAAPEGLRAAQPPRGSCPGRRGLNQVRSIAERRAQPLLVRDGAVTDIQAERPIVPALQMGTVQSLKLLFNSLDEVRSDPRIARVAQYLQEESSGTNPDSQMTNLQNLQDRPAASDCKPLFSLSQVEHPDVAKDHPKAKPLFSLSHAEGPESDASPGKPLFKPNPAESMPVSSLDDERRRSARFERAVNNFLRVEKRSRTGTSSTASGGSGARSEGSV